MGTELQDALRRIPEDWNGGLPETREPVLVLRKAARRVASGTEIRYCTWHESRMSYGADHCQTADGLHACTPSDYLLVERMETINERVTDD